MNRLLLNFIWYLRLLPIRYYTCIVHVIPSINILFHNFSCNCTTVYMYRWQILSKAIRLQLPSSTYDTRLRYKSKWGMTKLQNSGNFELNKSYLPRKNFFVDLVVEDVWTYFNKISKKYVVQFWNNTKWNKNTLWRTIENSTSEIAFSIKIIM